jgi:molybdopterin/thiamine biosynthesis adenylyltransferase
MTPAMTIINNVYKPTFFRLESEADKSAFHVIKHSTSNKSHDTIDTQILELLACRNPSLGKANILSSGMVDAYLREKNKTLETYGVWVYYPWKNQLVHILDEEEFIEVRTNRNKLKITQEEQETLRTKKIGIIGLSVGRAVATTIALERIAGEIRLADFDDIELSNLNRINAPLTEMGKNKTISAAQEIAELDPYITVTCFVEGYTEANADDFFCKGGKIDLVVEECDDIRVKIEARLKAREQRVPVIMETNDNCIIDIERYDLEPDREIFHGKLSRKEIKEAVSAESLIEKTAVLIKLFDIENITHRMKESIPEFGKTVLSWPQLGSEVIYGSGVTVALVRMLLLGQLKEIEQEYFGIERHLEQRKII